MICEHLSIKAKHNGQKDTCINCHVEIIWNGKWVWYYGLDATKRRKLELMFAIDRLTGAHA